MQLTVVDLKARIVRLGRLERGFAREIGLQRGRRRTPVPGAEGVPEGDPGRPGRRQGRPGRARRGGEEVGAGLNDLLSSRAGSLDSYPR
jgi:hypothetical protein